MANKFKLIDPYNRHLTYLRLSVTDRCNLNCLYCEPQKRIKKLSHDEILTYEELLKVARVGVQLGISKIRVTGGEPFVRKGVCQFLSALGNLEGLSELSLTTNAILLKNYLQSVRDAGIKRINISLDTLQREKYGKITGFDGFNRVWDTILQAHHMGFEPIKINVVVVEGVNDDEIPELAGLSLSYPFHIRFIEYMPIGQTTLPQGRPILADEIIRRISRLGKLEPIRSNLGDGPARRFKIRGSQGEIGLICPMSHHFCDRCNRLRLTADGKLRACLLSSRHIDLKSALRSDFSEKRLAGLFWEAVRQKPDGHHLSCDACEIVADQMSSIGG